jgi:molybdate transport system substrate-binding protein
MLLAAMFFAVSSSTLAAEITVSAAASLTNAFKDIAKSFEAAYPEHKVLLNFAGSGELLQQIAKGAPVDVFASADQETMDRAQAQGLLIDASRKDFIRNTLVVITPIKSTLKLNELADLQQKGLQRLAVSNPESVPVGRYSKQVLVDHDLWGVLADKIINTQNVRQSLDYVARDEVGAGFVYTTDAAIMADKVKVQFTVPLKTKVSYPIAVTKEGYRKELSQQFIDYMFNEESQAVLTGYGFNKL